MPMRLVGFAQCLGRIQRAVSRWPRPAATTRTSENFSRPYPSARPIRVFTCCTAARVALAGLLAVVLAPLVAQDLRTALNQHLQQAQVYLDGEQYDLVVRELEQAIRIHPNIPGAYYQLGLSHWHLQNMEQAKDAFLQELEFEPPDAFSLYYLGRIGLTEGNTEEAVGYFERVVAIGTILDVRSRLASGYLRVGRIGDAVELLEETVRRWPEQGENHYLLGQAYQRQGRTAEARHEFDLAQRWKNKLQDEIRALVELRMLLQGKKSSEADTRAKALAASGDPDVMLSAAIALGEHGFHTRALPILKRVAEIRPRYSETYYNMALAYVSMERPEDAVPSLEKAVELRPEFYEARALLGNLLAQAGKFEDAIPHLRMALTIRPDSAKLRAFLGLQFLRGRYYDEAVKSFQQAIELDPGNADLRFLLVDAHHKNHDFELALREAKATVAKFPESSTSHFQVASQLENMGRFEDAKGHLERAVAIDSGFAEAHRMLGEVALKLGDAEGSLSHFRRAITQDASSAEAYAGLGKALIQLRRHEEAVTEMERAIQRIPELAPLHLYLSQAYRATGRMEDAKREAATFTKLNQERARCADRTPRGEGSRGVRPLLA